MAQDTAPSGLTNRKVRTGVNTFTTLHSVAGDLAEANPQTALGKLALNLAVQNTVSVLSVSAVTAFVYAVREAALPEVTFRGPTPGPGINNADLQREYNTFQQAFTSFQGDAGQWVGGTNSILSQLTSVPKTLSNLDSAVKADITTLQNTEPSSTTYKETLKALKKILSGETSTITNLKQQLETLGTLLQNNSVALTTAADSGVLKKLQDAYAHEIQSLINDINNAQSQIDSDNKKIIGLGFAAAAAIVVGLVGLANIWNPVGWFMIAGGAVGAYFAIAEIGRLKGEIANLKTRIQNDTLWKQTDSNAAASIATFSNQLKGFAVLNTGAQEELTQLETLYQTLATDIGDMVSDLDSEKLTDAMNEWDTVIAAAAPLADLTAYLWPSALLLPDPTSFSAAGNAAYALDNAGYAYKYVDGGNTWTKLPDTALSIVAKKALVVAIDGAPGDGSAIIPNPTPSSFNVKTYSSDTNLWTTISTFPAAAITTDGDSIYAINQTTSDRQVYKYGGSGTSWTKLADLPGPDAAAQIAIADGVLFAIANNTQLLYKYDGSAWSQVGTLTVASITGNGDKLGIIGTDTNPYLYDVSTNTGPTQSGNTVMGMAQITNGDQYVINNPTLDLWFIDNQANPRTSTRLKHNATGVFSSETDVVYYTDNQGDVYKLNDEATNLWTQLPPFPDS